MQSEHMKKLLFPIYSLFFFLWTLDAGKRRLRSGRSPGRWPGCSSARSKPRLRCTGRRGGLAAGLMTLWPGHGWPGSATPSCGGPGFGAVNGEARRVKATVAGCGPAVAGSGGQSSLRKEEERERNASSSAVLPSSTMALAGRGREERERENGEGVSGEEGPVPLLEHGEV